MVALRRLAEHQGRQGVRDYDAARHAESLRTKDWRWAEFPDSGKLPRPVHPDGDEKFKKFPGRRVSNSDAIMRHVKRTGKLNISTGDANPDYAGKTEGVFLNFAHPDDPYYTISKNNGSKNLTVITGYAAPYGKKVRIGDWMIVQGWPMNEYSDSKLHIVDLEDRTITEIQYATEARRNPFLTWVLGLFGQRPGFHCHGVTQYSMDIPSTDESVKGSCAARWPLAESAIRFDDYLSGNVHVSTCAVPAARKGRFVPPALSSDGPSDDQTAIQMGQLFRLTDEAFTRLYNDPAMGPQSKFLFCCWYLYGILVVDTGGHIGFGPEPDKRWDQTDLKAGTEKVSLDDFMVCEY